MEIVCENQYPCHVRKKVPGIEGNPLCDRNTNSIERDN